VGKTTEIIILYLLILLFAVSGRSQCPIEEQSFQYGEKLTYEVSYNWSFISINAGKVTFETDTKIADDKEYFHFISTGKSYSIYNWFYEVNDSLSSVVDTQTLSPLEFHRKTSEGNYKVNNSYLFDRNKNILVSSTQNSKKPLATDTFNLAPCTFDVLSAVYYIRTLNFSDKTPGHQVVIRFIIDGEFYEIPVKYLDKEIISNKDNTKYNCIKFSAKLVPGTIFKDGKEIFVWVTDDKNKIPIKVEASILAGSIKAYLSGYQGLKHDLTSQIE